MASWSFSRNRHVSFTRPHRAACLNRRDLLYEKLNQIPGISIAVKPAGAMCPIGDEEKDRQKTNVIYPKIQVPCRMDVYVSFC